MEPQREWFKRDYYKVLNVAPQATKAEIIKAYRSLAKQLHPDTHPGDTASVAKFKRVNVAYGVLSDPEKRQAYDEIHDLNQFSSKPNSSEHDTSPKDPEGTSSTRSQSHSTSSRSQRSHSTNSESQGASFSYGNFESRTSGQKPDRRNSERHSTVGDERDSKREGKRGGENSNFKGFSYDAFFDGNTDSNATQNNTNHNATQSKAVQGKDLHTVIRLDFADAVKGTTVTIPVNGNARCLVCNGSGAKPGTKQDTCKRCKGAGYIDSTQGTFSMSRPCPDCDTTGYINLEPCTNCVGSGVEHRLRNIKTRIPAGVDDGQKIRLKGQGEPGKVGGEAGDLYVQIEVIPHHLFKREGTSLALNVPITFAEAVLGVDVIIPKLSGSTLLIRVPPGTSTGQRMRVRDNTQNGVDIIAIFEVIVPHIASLTEEQRAAIHTLADAAHTDPREHLKPLQHANYD